MSKINDLIRKLCPNGVEYKKLEDCCKILDNKRKPVSKGLREIGIYPYYGANGIQDYINDYLFEGYFVLVGEDGSVKTDNDTPVVNWAAGKIWVNNHAHIIEELEGVSLRYLYHYLQIVNIKDLIHGNIPKLNQRDFRNIKIAVPPIEIQNEIVRILDKFGELEVELEAELEARKSQYEFWCGIILSGKLFDNFETIQIGDIGKICMCKRVMKHETNEIGGIPFYKIKSFGGVADTYISEKIYNQYKHNYSYPKKGDILISASGTIGKTVIFDGKPSYFQDSNIVWVDNDESKVLNKYLYYAYSIIEWKVEGGTIKRLYNDNLKSAKIIVPSIENQKRVINILDKFNELINDILFGLPAEIELRRKQYEYYRNKLLSFEELKNE